MGFRLSCSALAPRKAIPWLLAGSCDFERPKHATRSLLGTKTCAVVYRRPPCVARRREREKRPTGAGEKRVHVEKKNALVHSNISYSRVLPHQQCVRKSFLEKYRPKNYPFGKITPKVIFEGFFLKKTHRGQLVLQ